MYLTLQAFWTYGLAPPPAIREFAVPPIQANTLTIKSAGADASWSRSPLTSSNTTTIPALVRRRPRQREDSWYEASLPLGILARLGRTFRMHPMDLRHWVL